MTNAVSWRGLKNWAGCGLLALATLLPGLETAAVAAAPKFSWAKPDVAYEQYRSDALNCGNRSLATDISRTEPVQVLRQATSQMESYVAASGNATTPEQAVRNAQDMESVRASARPNQQIKRIKEIIFVSVRSCMVELGYVRIALTEPQRNRYDSISDSVEQLRYLHSLASDPAVVASQQSPLPG